MTEKTGAYRIAVVIDSYTRGGVAMAAQVLLQFLAKENLDITLFVRNYDPQNMLPLPEGITCRPWADVGTGSLANRLRVLLNWRNFGRKAIWKARCRDMFPGEYDCAVGYQMVANDVTLVTLEKIRAKRKVLWLHGKKKFPEPDRAFYDELYSGADKIVCVSLETEARFQKLMPKSASRTETIHNLYDISGIRTRAAEAAEGMDTNSGAVKIVSVGRISKEKGFDRVAEVVRRLTDGGYDVRWYIVGDGDKRADVEADIQKRQVADRVILLGHKANPYPYIRGCDIYVQPSYTEGFCTSTVEAKILARPVVATDVPGMREQFTDGENGLIVESSVDGIYEGLCRLLDAPELREQFTEKLHREPVSNEEVLCRTIEVIKGTKIETVE